MNTVFVVQHVHVLDEDREEVKLIGVYSSRSKAEAAVNRLKQQPGFRDHVDGFSVDEITIDRDHWTEGFITERWYE